MSIDRHWSHIIPADAQLKNIAVSGAFLRWILQSQIILISLYLVALVKMYFRETFLYRCITCVIDTIICI